MRFSAAKNFRITIILVIGVILGGSGVYLWQRVMIKGISEESQKQIIRLEGEKAQLELNLNNQKQGNTQQTQTKLTQSTYRNDQYGFEFQYPSGENPEVNGNKISFQKADVEGSTIDTFTLMIENKQSAAEVNGEATDYLNKNSNCLEKNECFTVGRVTEMVSDSVNKNGVFSGINIGGLYFSSGGLCYDEEAKLFIPERQVELAFLNHCSDWDMRTILKTLKFF